QDRITVVKLPLIEFSSWDDNLVPGGYDRSVYLAADCHIRKTLRGQERNRSRTNPLAARKNFLTFCQIATAPADEFTWIDIHIHYDFIAFARRVFLHDNRVCPGGYRGACKNPNRFAGRNPKLPINASRLLSGYSQSRAFPG